MKPKILLLLFILSATFSYAQKKGNTVTTEWLKHPCYSGVEYKVINYNYKNSDGEAYWGIIVRNAYGAPLTCEYSLKIGGVSWASGFDQTYELAPGKTYSHSDGGLVTAMNFKSSSTNYTFEVKNVKVGETKFGCENGRQINLTQKEKVDTYNQSQYNTASELVERKNQLCIELGKLVKGQANNVYAHCQAKTYGAGDVGKLQVEVKQLEDEIHRLKYESPSNNGMTNQQKTNSNNQQTELQRQQQENQRIANQSQHFINVYNEGVDLQRSGNFAGAKEKYQQAIGLATNETQRKQAQNTYDKVSKSENQIQTTQAILTTIATISKNIKTTNWEDGNTVANNDLFDYFTSDVITEMEKIGFIYTYLNSEEEENYLKILQSNGTIIERKRTLNFEFQNSPFALQITSRFISEGNGTYFNISSFTTNKNIENSLKNNRPFKVFKSAYGSEKYNYSGRSMIKYSTPINQKLKNLFIEKKEQNITEKTQNLSIDYENNFNLPFSDNHNTINIVVVNLFTACAPCIMQYETFEKLNGKGYDFYHIIVSTNLERDKKFFSSYIEKNGHKAPVFNDIISIDTFNPKDLNAEGVLPMIFIYKGKKLKSKLVGFHDYNEIQNAIDTIK